MRSVGMNSSAVGAGAYRPPSWTKSRTEISCAREGGYWALRPTAQDFSPTLSSLVYCLATSCYRST